MSIERDRRWKMGGGAVVLLIVMVPLFREFSTGGLTIWNVCLGVLLIGITVGAVALQRYLIVHIDEVGEARFDTRNKDDR